jgi:hypothetical protein
MKKMIFEMPAIGKIISMLAYIKQTLDELTKQKPSKFKLLHTKEIADALGFSLRLLKKKRRRSVISFTHHGGIFRFRPSDFLQNMKANQIINKVKKGGTLC